MSIEEVAQELGLECKKDYPHLEQWTIKVPQWEGVAYKWGVIQIHGQSVSGQYTVYVSSGLGDPIDYAAAFENLDLVKVKMLLEKLISIVDIYDS